LQNLDEEALVGIADRLGGNGPTLGGVFRQLPVLEMQAPIQKIKNGRYRKTCRGFPIREGGEPLALSDMKHSYQFRRLRKSL
jgi:hypothetical protein